MSNNDWYKKGELPPLEELLMGGKVFSENGVLEWFDFPRYKVVGHHINGNSFFVECLDQNGNAIGSAERFEVGCKQYKPFKSPQEQELDEFIKEVQELMGCKKAWNIQTVSETAHAMFYNGYRKVEPFDLDAKIKKLSDKVVSLLENRFTHLNRVEIATTVSATVELLIRDGHIVESKDND